MRTTLIYPGITECGFGALSGNEGTWINHGLAILSASAKAAGHQVELIDLRRLSGWDEFSDRIAASDSQAFGISMMSVDFNPGTKAASIIKEIKPSSTVFVGGPHASICPHELVSLEYIDCTFKGEGEISFPRLLDELDKGNDIPHLVEGERLDNLNDAPLADRDIFGGAEEPFVSFLDAPFVTLIAGRGCKYNCNYCQPAERMMFGHNVRRRSVESVIDELKLLKDKYHFNSWMLHDDCITEDTEWVMEFVKRYKAEGFNEPFVCQSRADIICKNEDMVKALSSAGLKLFIIGFESGSDRVLKFLRKGCTRSQNLRAAQVCHENGIKVWANYMLGLPTETNDEVLETLSMLEEIRPYHCSPAFYTPHPGSDLYELGKEMGIHLITSHDSYRRNTYQPKIDGPDYEFLKKALYRSIAIGEDAGGIRRAAGRWPRVYTALKAVKRRLAGSATAGMEA